MSTNIEDDLMDKSVHSSAEDRTDAFREIRDIRKKHSKNTIIAHVNINSLKNKFFEITDILYDKVPDILFLSETKIDDTYSQNQFSVPGYRVFRNDRNIHGGGILCLCQIHPPGSTPP